MLSIFFIIFLGLIKADQQVGGLKRFLRFILGWKYELYSVDKNNIPKDGGILLLGNHQSFIDWAFVILAMDRPVKFVIADQYYKIPVLKQIFKWAGLVPISISSSKKAIDKVVETLNAGEAIAMFPEGQLTRNGHIGHFKRGFEIIGKSANCQIVPFYLHGLWGSFFSHCNPYFRMTSKKNFRRKVYIGFGKPMDRLTSSGALKQRIYQISTLVVERATSDLNPVPISWIKNAKRTPTQTALVNFDGKKYTNTKLIVAVLLFTEFIRKQDRGNKRIGILLPSSSGSAITNLAGMAVNKTVVNLNYTSSVELIQYSINDSGIKTVYTSSVFLERLKQRGLDTDKALAGCDVVILEEISKGTDKKTLLKMVAKVLTTPTGSLIEKYFDVPLMGSEAAILYSSGSEGKPKGVVLTHRNIAANTNQIALVFAQRKSDCFLNSLPPFHAFGLTATTLTPLVEGIKQVCAPDPTDPQAVGKLISENKCTVLFATSTFANIYSRSPKIKPEDFTTLRYVVLGAEKLREEVRIAFEMKFMKTMYEGYGTTECSPVVSVNLPDFMNKNDGVVQQSNVYGTVGQCLPGTCAMVIDPETEENLGFDEDGLLIVSGPQIMKGYYHLPEKTSQVLFEKDGQTWYKTGDKARISAEGFIKIVDRYSRFAKIGGEMISLAMVEDHLLQLIGDAELELSAVALPDANKGEIIALLVSNLKAEVDELTSKIQHSDIHAMYRPRKIIKVAEIPKLGSGKTDFTATKRLAQSMLHA